MDPGAGTGLGRLAGPASARGRRFQLCPRTLLRPRVGPRRMLIELLRLVLVVGLLVVLPGWLLVNALFPPRRSSRLGWAERAYLSLVGGILLLILVSVLLGFLPHDGRGYFQTIATGMPNVELATLAVSALLFYVGLHRGAYPRVAARYPQLLHPEARAANRSPGPHMR